MEPGTKNDAIAEDPSSPDAATQSIAEAPRRTRRLLLVDDTPANLKILARLLEKQGYRTESAEDGRQAIECFLTSEFDAILMDLQMPGLDGFGATEAIRARTDRKQVPIIALTAHAVDGTRERCFEVGMSDYLIKPVDIALLTATIEAHLTASGYR